MAVIIMTTYDKLPRDVKLDSPTHGFDFIVRQSQIDKMKGNVTIEYGDGVTTKRGVDQSVAIYD